MPEPIPVRVRDCACPDAPHAEGDIVYLRPKPSLDLGVAATQAISEAGGDGDKLTRTWIRLFVTLGTTGSNFLPADPWDPAPLLDDFELSKPVADAATDLYAEILLRPLGLSLSKPSPGGLTRGSTSRPRASRRRSPG